MMLTREIETATTLWYRRYVGIKSSISTRFEVVSKQHDEDKSWILAVSESRDLNLVSVESLLHIQ